VEWLFTLLVSGYNIELYFFTQGGPGGVRHDSVL